MKTSPLTPYAKITRTETTTKVKVKQNLLCKNQTLSLSKPITHLVELTLH